MNSSPSFNSPRTDLDQPVADLSKAPLPTEKTLRLRRSIPAQIARFAVFNARIMKMVAKAH
jgi:hypothetical protein